MLGRTIVLGLFVTAISGTVHAILPAVILLMPFSRSAYRAVVDTVEWAWLTNASALIELVAGVEVIATGVRPAPNDKRMIILCNHNNRLDWLFLWCLASRIGLCSSLKIALKEGLRKAPFFGWATQAFLFVFFSRKDRNGDLAHLRATLGHGLGHGDDTVLLIFPEGTDLSPSNQALDAEFAKKKGLETYAHVLHPRVVGFAEAVTAFGDGLDAIYDVTVRYDNHPAVAAAADPRPSEASALFKGLWPRRVHFHCDRHAASAIQGPSTAEWLTDAWTRKEKLLAASAAFPSPADGMGRPTFTYLSVLLGWATVTIMLLMHICSSHGWALRLYTLLGTATLEVFTRWGGLDALERWWHPAGVRRR